MNKELTVLIGATFILILLGLGAILAIVFLRPNADNTHLVTAVVDFMLPTILAFIAAFKGVQNSRTLVELKEQGNGHMALAVKQAAETAQLTEQIVGLKTAAAIAQNKVPTFIESSDPPSLR